MKYLDFTSLLETEPAQLAVLSTFQFDADFFERRLIRCSALLKARRILVFMDASQWFNLLRQDITARFLNRRYLVVPVRPKQGVFHPKLNLLIREDGGQILCGSNNLTRSGCSSNLELLNSFSITAEKLDEELVRMAQEAYEFFIRACDDADEESGRIARQWLEELRIDAPWLFAKIPTNTNQAVELVHTYNGSLWDRVTNALSDHTPNRFFVISPFFDQDADLAQRIFKRWPKCQIEIIVQQQRTNLPVAALEKFRDHIILSELGNSTRRLHAKLIAWESNKGMGCLVGSANFTTAAFDARNIEACFLFSNANELVAGLFDGHFTKRPLAFDDFCPGTENEPEADELDNTTLRLRSAVLMDGGRLRVNYQHQLPIKPSKFRIAIRTYTAPLPLVFVDLPNKENGTVTLTFQESVLAGVHGTILVSLVAEVEGKDEESPPVWAILENHLTYESNIDGSVNAKSIVEESGEGLIEYLDDLAKRTGISTVIEFLQHLNIRFSEGGSGNRSGRLFRLRIRDPFYADIAPSWLANTKKEKDELSDAICDFADRHEKQRLRRHAKRGNINGMGNFIDILNTLIKLLCAYKKDEVPNRYKCIKRILTYVDLATHGLNDGDDYCEGYLSNIYNNISDSEYLQEVCNELNFLGHVRAAFAIAQSYRYVPNEQAKLEKPPMSPRECFPDRQKLLCETIARMGLNEPGPDCIMMVLKKYNIFSTEVLNQFELQI